MNALARKSLIAEIRLQRALFKLKGRRRRVYKKLPRQAEPTQQRRAYFALIKRTVLARIKGKLDNRLKPWLKAHFDAAGDDDVNDILDELGDDLLEGFTNEAIREMLAPIADQIMAFNKQQLGGQLEAGLGVNPIASEPYLAADVEGFMRDNVALIKSIPSEFFSDLEKKLSAGISDGLRHEELADIIQERYDVAESRAALIARDQTGKFYGDLNKSRQSALGITSYIWRTVKDSRVREEHAEREGEEFEWTDPPEDGNPGEPINCRCYADPVLQPVLDELEE